MIIVMTMKQTQRVNLEDLQELIIQASLENSATTNLAIVAIEHLPLTAFDIPQPPFIVK